MAVEEIFTMASRSFRILGSGTFSTCTVLRPDQTLARMSDPRLLELGVVQRLRRALIQLPLELLTLWRALRARHLARLHLLLEVTQVVHHLRARVRADHFLDDLAELAARGAVVQVHVDLGAAV